jgi:outer membrane protein
MNNKKYLHCFQQSACSIIIVILIISGVYTMTVRAGQIQSDSLSIDSVIRAVVSIHPSVQQAEEALNAADAKIGLAKSGYYPTADITASYTFLYPVRSIRLSADGPSFDMFPMNNYSTALNLNQTIYAFGRNATRVHYEMESKNLNEQSLEFIKQQLTMRTISAYYILIYLQEALKIADSQLKNLQDHYDYVKKKQETGSATSYEVLSTQVRISGIQSQILDLQASRETTASVLNLLMGKSENAAIKLKKDIDINPYIETQDSVIAEALRNRNEMLTALEKEKLSQMSIKIAKTEYYPSLHAFATGKFNNGNLDNLYKFEPNLVAGISLVVPIYEATRTKNSVSLAHSAFLSSTYETESIRRRIVGEVVESYQKETSAIKKIDQYQLQYDQATKAYDLALTSFNSGSITNLDLLDASNSLGQSQLNLLKSKIDCLVSWYNLKIAIGVKLYE